MEDLENRFSVHLRITSGGANPNDSMVKPQEHNNGHEQCLYTSFALNIKAFKIYISKTFIGISPATN